MPVPQRSLAVEGMLTGASCHYTREYLTSRRAIGYIPLDGERGFM